MARAYVTIMADPGRERSLKSEIAAISGVVGVDLTSGDQDLICTVESDSFKTILDTVVNRIRVLDGVANTRTRLVLE